jgi:hypothetical protein
MVRPGNSRDTGEAVVLCSLCGWSKCRLHGIQHAMNEATPSEKKRLRSLVRKVASKDRSSEVRDYATYTLTDGGCSKEPGERR